MWKLPWNHPLLTVLLGICLTSLLTSVTGMDGECSSNQFSCLNGRCISMVWHCDGEDDCRDNSDETNCTNSVTCDEESFKCVSEAKCIPNKWKCDQGTDCRDGSDEAPELCAGVNRCKENEVQCANNITCIEKAWLCDGENDCPDQSDEQNCEKTTCANDTFFQCVSDGQCVDAKWKCDGRTDCADGSDEAGCPVSNNTCGEYEFMCANKKCVEESWRCDGEDDCEDMSDEQNCPVTEKTCSDSEFQCKTLDRTCIHINWECDGDDDCEDRSDEKHCNITCKPDQFLCDNYCIPSSLRCDGQQDCMNGSDEDNCPTVAPICVNNTFDCHGDGTKCIPYKLVCDGWNDCGNNEDEHTDGHNACPEENPCDVNNGGCQHVCYRAPKGVICDCHMGFELVNKTECVDIDECKVPGVCSQLCQNTKGSYKCECVPGYELEKQHICKATMGQPELLLADRQDLRRYHLLRKTYTLLIDSKDVEGAVAMDFHFAGSYVFWTDVGKKEIKRVNLKENVIETVASENVTTPDGLAVDWVHGHIYWTDTGLDHIEVATLNGSLRSVLISTDLDEPRAIALHPSKGLMFWTDWGYAPKIESCGMNGQHRQVIISEDITWPNGLTIDYVDNRLYWIDAKLHLIGSSDLDGGNRRTIMRSHRYLGHPFAITVFEDYLYWSDWPSESIRRCNKFQKGDVETVAHGLDTPTDIHIFHPYRQEAYNNTCGTNNGGCEQFCLPDPVNKFTCVCKTGFMPDPQDNTKCIKGIVPTVKPTPPKPTAGSPTIAPKPTAASPKPTTVAPVKPHPNSSPKAPSAVTTEPGSVDVSTEKGANDTEGMPINKEQEEGLGNIAIIVIAVVLVISLVIITVGVFVFRRHRNKNIKSMNFDNPVYRKTTTADDDAVFVEVSGSRQNLPSSMQPLNPDHQTV